MVIEIKYNNKAQETTFCHATQVFSAFVRCFTKNWGNCSCFFMCITLSGVCCTILTVLTDTVWKDYGDRTKQQIVKSICHLCG